VSAGTGFLFIGMAKGFLFDIDGTLQLDNVLIPGALDILSKLIGDHLPFLLVTNSTIKSRKSILNLFRDNGLNLRLENILNPETVAYNFINSEHKTAPIRLMLREQEFDWSIFNLVEENPEFIILGDLGEGFSRELLDDLMNQVLSGATLVALHKSKFWRVDKEIKVDLGGYVALLEYTTDKKAITIGKPSPSFFNIAAQILGIDIKDLVMVGDDIYSDVLAASDAGLMAILVKTGKFQESFLQIAKEKNIEVISSIKSLNLQRLINNID